MPKYETVFLWNQWVRKVGVRIFLKIKGTPSAATSIAIIGEQNGNCQGEFFYGTNC
jgi:hypothetical protein